MGAHVTLDQNAIAEFCRRHRIRRLGLFGSVLREDFDPDSSDVDVLIEFEPGAEDGLTYFRLARMQFELEALFGRSVDLSLATALDPFLRDRILASTEMQYVAA